jgi:hypothetical protein
VYHIVARYILPSELHCNFQNKCFETQLITHSNKSLPNPSVVLNETFHYLSLRVVWTCLMMEQKVLSLGFLLRDVAKNFKLT